MIVDNKKRHVVSYEKLSGEVLDAFNEKYPGGLQTCIDDVQKYPRPDGSFFHAVTLELPQDIYLVKVQIQVDDAEDIKRWLESEEVAETEQVAGGSSESDSDTLPDDNFSDFGTDDDSSEA